MYNPTLRLLAILEFLQARGVMSGDELARALEIDKRSLRRYITMLRDMGIPIEAERGRHGGYSLRPGFRLPPLMFNADEITAVMLGLKLLQTLGATSHTPIESAAAKIERVLPEDLRLATDALRSSLILDDVRTGTHPVSSEWILAFSRAAQERTLVEITYLSAEGETTQRKIAPYGLVLHARTWYVPAYCYLREAMRIFRLDRMRSVSRFGQRFDRSEDFDAKAFVLDSLARLPGTYTFEVVLHAPLLTVQEYISPTLAVLENVNDDKYTLLRCYSDDPYWLARYLVQLEMPFTVVATEELRHALRTLADEILASVPK